jgi:DNA-binding NarL/FixJ family response regulator
VNLAAGNERFNVTSHDIKSCYALRMTERGRLFLRALTESERRILVLVCAGWSNGRIAESVSTSEQVIKNRMRLILQKAGKRSRFELIVFAFGSGTVACPCRAASRMELEQRREKPVDMLAPGA